MTVSRSMPISTPLSWRNSVLLNGQPISCIQGPLAAVVENALYFFQLGWNGSHEISQVSPIYLLMIALSVFGFTPSDRSDWEGWCRSWRQYRRIRPKHRTHCHPYSLWSLPSGKFIVYPVVARYSKKDRELSALTKKYNDLQSLIGDLEAQLKTANKEKERWQTEYGVSQQMPEFVVTCTEYRGR